MNDSLLAAAGTAFYLGFITSISPCPLATNIAAISFISRRVGDSRYALLSGLLYTIGRTATYLVLGVAIVAGALSIPSVSNFLQVNINKILGPVLILAGMFLLELIAFGGTGRGVSEQTQKRVEKAGIWGALLLGVLFALSFCPVSAAWFFGSLIPLSIKHASPVLLPCVFGAGTALPVILFAFLIAFSAQSLGKAFKVLTQVEWWARRITGVVFILAGIYYSLIYIFGVLQ